MMHRLEQQYGPVRHIVLGTVALEHKATFGPFAQKFPKATVWVQPGQWSFPLSLPLAPALGVIQRGSQLRQLPPPHQPSVQPPEWIQDIEYEILGPLLFRSVGGFSETAFFHKPSRTLLVTDTVVSVPNDPPLIIQEDPRAMLFHARDSIQDVVQDTPETRRKGWRRMVQFGLIFFPSQIDVVPFNRALIEAFQIDPSMRTLGEGAVPLSLYPWTWHSNNADLKNFEAISQNGKIFCPPILTKLILDREPQRVLEWVDKVATRFNFVRILPGHLANNVMASPTEFREAFQVLNSNSEKRGTQRPLAEDLALLQKASDLLTKLKIVDASKVCDGEPARIVGRFSDRNKN